MNEMYVCRIPARSLGVRMLFFTVYSRDEWIATAFLGKIFSSLFLSLRSIYIYVCVCL